MPENNTSLDRTVRVETIIKRDYRFNEDVIEFDPGDNTWQTVWEAVQLSNKMIIMVGISILIDIRKERLLDNIIKEIEE